ncbi:unnamed protein product [Adineta ricciae]|uniref:Uncharacterized protein n=1 Tax=Adineta ricciae TaxID=249248 RepID=A0A815XII2_ADIRI|nr:unnamed protein product [Adineta ricciae]
MLLNEMLHFFIILFIIKQISAYSYNRPKLYSDSTWNPNGITIFNNTFNDSNLFDIFININNTIYILNKQILVFKEENFILI